MLPGIVEKDLDLFGSSVNAIQGLRFKNVEHSLQPQQIPGLMERLHSAGEACVGMSSFGPAVYAIGDTDMWGIERAARSYMDELYRGNNPDHVFTEYGSSGESGIKLSSLQPVVFFL